MKNSNISKIVTLFVFMFLGAFLGMNIPLEAQTTGNFCGTCDMETYENDPYLGEIGFCDTVAPAVIDGCSSNNGSECVNTQCSNLPERA